MPTCNFSDASWRRHKAGLTHQFLSQPEDGVLYMIDLKRVEQTMGELPVFDYVATAFLGQLAAWRADFDHRSIDFDQRSLTAAVHKMKGSCQAVAALGLAHEFEQVERALPHMQAQEWPAFHAKLVSQLVLLEAEIRTIMTRVNTR